MKPPAFQFYAADFLVGTSTMTNEEVGIYIRLLCHQWDRGFVAKDKASRIVGAEIPSDVLNKFVEADGELRNQRLETERRKQSDFREQKSLSGKAGAAARWSGSRDGTRHPSANGETMAPPSSCQRQNDSPPSPSSSSSSVFKSSSSIEWREVEDRLEKEGMAKATEAVAEARKRSYTPERAMLVIEHYLANAGAWNLGALFARLTRIGSNIPIEEGWVKPSAGYVKAVAKQKHERETQATARRTAEQAALTASTKADEDARLAALEQSRGHELDQLPETELRELIASSGDAVLIDLSRRLEPRKPGSSLRRRLLCLLGRDDDQEAGDGPARSPPDATAPTKTSDSRQRVARPESTHTTAQGSVP